MQRERERERESRDETWGRTGREIERERREKGGETAITCVAEYDAKHAPEIGTDWDGTLHYL